MEKWNFNFFEVTEGSSETIRQIVPFESVSGISYGTIYIKGSRAFIQLDSIKQEQLIAYKLWLCR